MPQSPKTDPTLLLREPAADEGQALHEMIRRSPPLDLNSVYCYFLLARHFRQTCIVAEAEGTLVGCVTAYQRPDVPETLFVWQVAVLAAQRGAGLAGRMLEALLARPACQSVRYLETTVGPTNHASRRCFSRLAETHRCPLHESPFLKPNHFGPEVQHEAEVLLRIGPFATPTRPSATKEGIQNGNF